MTGHLIDSNIILDVVTVDPVWLDWSAKQLQVASDAGELLINPII